MVEIVIIFKMVITVEMAKMVEMVIIPVLESMRAREPGLQAPSNLTGSKIKSTHIFFPSYDIEYWEEQLPCWLS